MTEEQIQQVVMALRNLAETARDIDTHLGDPQRLAYDIAAAWEVLNVPEVVPLWLPGGQQ